MLPLARLEHYSEERWSDTGMAGGSPFRAYLSRLSAASVHKQVRLGMPSAQLQDADILLALYIAHERASAWDPLLFTLVNQGPMRRLDVVAAAA